VESAAAAQATWTKIVRSIRTEISDQTFRTWFMPLRAISIHEQELEIEVPNPFYIDWLSEHYGDLLRRSSSAVEPPVHIIFSVSRRYSDAALPAAETPAAVRLPAPVTAPRNGTGLFLNPRFTFDTFVVGKNSEFCHAASAAVARDPGLVFNPLFIYGGVGLGKTHIMHAIGRRLIEVRPTAIVRYVSSETFTNELIQAIQRGSTFEFKRTYRSADLLLIDDIQFLARKESTQEEFFHTFNTLYDAQKQIVITSDRPPTELQDLEGRLVSRFNWGLVTDIQPPDYETRVAILRRKAEREKITIPADVLCLIAERVTNNVRALEGSLVRLSALASLTGSVINVELAECSLRDVFGGRAARRMEVVDVVTAVAQYYNASVEALQGRRRTSGIAFPRQVAMYLAKRLTKASLVETGKCLGGRDHTTVLYAVTKVEEMLKHDPAVRQAIDAITQKLMPPDARA
jgi:chromosomal replication initiator protein